MVNLRFPVPFGAQGQRRLFILGSLESSYWVPISHKWTFFARSKGWAATSEYRLKIVFLPRFWSWVGQFDPKFQVEGGVPQQPFFMTEKVDEFSFHMVQESRRNFRSFCHNTHMWWTDGETDRWHCRQKRPCCIQCSVVKANNYVFSAKNSATKM